MDGQSKRIVIPPAPGCRGTGAKRRGGTCCFLLLWDDFYEGAVRQLAAEYVHHSVFHQAAEHHSLVGRRRSLGWSGGRAGSRSPAHSAVHGHIGQPVCMAVLLPQNMLDLEMVKPRNTALGLLVQRTEFGAVHAILPLDLLDHQLGVGDNPQTPV